MYSSGGDLHLELPEGGLEADDSLWQIPPYHTKPVMRATFLARAENNHTAYIRYVGKVVVHTRVAVVGTIDTIYYYDRFPTVPVLSILSQQPV